MKMCAILHRHGSSTSTRMVNRFNIEQELGRAELRPLRRPKAATKQPPLSQA